MPFTIEDAVDVTVWSSLKTKKLEIMEILLKLMLYLVTSGHRAQSDSHIAQACTISSALSLCSRPMFAWLQPGSSPGFVLRDRAGILLFI